MLSLFFYIYVVQMSVILALSLTFTLFSPLAPETFLVFFLGWVWMTVD